MVKKAVDLLRGIPEWQGRYWRCRNSRCAEAVRMTRAGWVHVAESTRCNEFGRGRRKTAKPKPDCPETVSRTVEESGVVPH